MSTLQAGRFVSRVHLTAENRVGCWVCAIAAGLSLLSSPTIARAQRGASAPGIEFPEAVSDPNATIDTVEVAGKREAIRKAIQAFVANMTRTDGENLARWRTPICPVVSGVSREQGEFVRLRILEIATLAGAPPARKEKCRSNLFVVLTPQPDAILTKWRARNPRMFGGDSAEKIGSAQGTMPVRTWHNAMLNNADGTPPIEDANKAPEYRLKDSRIASSVAEDISAVVVLVDTNETGTATFGQLADYVAMVGLARLDLHADLASSSTILRLFAPPNSESVPSGLTNWDQAFLKGLYKSHAPLLRQRAHVAASMAQDLVP